MKTVIKTGMSLKKTTKNQQANDIGYRSTHDKKA